MGESKPTYVFRIVHVANLPTLLQRRGLHAPNHQPDDGLSYRVIHDPSLQIQRHREEVPCGPGGMLHDYVPFYFGCRSPMLLRLHTGRVDGYDEDQRPIVYLVSAVETVRAANLRFVFSDGHGLAHYTRWFDAPSELERLDWKAIHAKYWRNDEQDNDRERRKQAEFLVHRFCPWEVVRGLAVVDDGMKVRVERVLGDFPDELRREVIVRPDWYY